MRKIPLARVVFVGADVVDGSYDPNFALRMLEVVACSHDRGVDCVILGSSFSVDASRSVEAALAALHRRVTLYARDSVSQARMTARIGWEPRLSADVAFLLRAKEGGHADERTAAWKASAGAGRTIVCVCLHYALFETVEAAQAFAARLARQMGAFARHRHVAWMLVPHDYRSYAGDSALAKIIGDILASEAPELVLNVQDPLDCDELKAVVRHADLVVTGRMHLAIAALGMQVPILCLAYKDKFEGLLQHFRLSPHLLLQPKQLEAGELLERIALVMDELPCQRAAIARRHEAVVTLAASNFA